MDNPYRVPYDPKDLLDTKIIDFPEDIQAIFPAEALESLTYCRTYAYRVIEMVKDHSEFDKGLYACSCPEASEMHKAHNDSVTRLLSWQKRHGEDKTLTTTAKIPAFVLKFHFDKQMHTKFIICWEEASHVTWTCTGGDQLIEKMMDVFEIVDRTPLEREKRVALNNYLALFMHHMNELQTYLLDVKYPSFEESIQAVHALIQERVEDPEECIKQIVIT